MAIYLCKKNLYSSARTLLSGILSKNRDIFLVILAEWPQSKAKLYPTRLPKVLVSYSSIHCNPELAQVCVLEIELELAGWLGRERRMRPSANEQVIQGWNLLQHVSPGPCIRLVRPVGDGESGRGGVICTPREEVDANDSVLVCKHLGIFLLSFCMWKVPPRLCKSI